MTEPQRPTEQELYLWSTDTYGNVVGERMVLLLNEVVRLRAEVESLRRDRERLDWLEGELEREGLIMPPEWPRPRSLFRLNNPITRAAIDAALCRDREGSE